MIEELGQIDTESIDELIEIKQNRDVLVERLGRLDDQRGKVSEIVLDRVRVDYETQRAALAEKAAPLEAKARAEFSKLQDLLTVARKAREATGLDREELELRHQLGEFGDAEFTEQRDQIDEKLARHEEGLTAIEATRESFIAAFDSEEELAEPAAKDLETEQAREHASVPVLNVYETQDTERGGVGNGGDSEADGEDEAPVDKDESQLESGIAETVIEPSEAIDELSAEPAPDMHDMPPQALPTGGTLLRPMNPPLPDIESDLPGTTVLQQARLVPVEPIAGGSEFSVEPVTTIGRTKENLIRVDEPAVSRGHAQISLTEEGYILRDLGSENGTFVNGERVDTRVLLEGDRIQIGTVRFVFYDAGP
jgi:hypothetical protein